MMIDINLINSENNIDNNIEDNNNIVDNNVIIRSILKSKKTIKNKSWIKFYMILFYTCIICPFIFCDYYYSQNNNICVKQKTYTSLTMYVYLLISGTYFVFILAIIILSIIFIDFLNLDKNNYIIKIFERIFLLFLISWTIIGTVIYWVYMNKSLCSINTNNYIFISLIIKLSSFLYSIYKK